MPVRPGERMAEVLRPAAIYKAAGAGLPINAMDQAMPYGELQALFAKAAN